MRIIPVLDLWNGVVVRAVAGNRDSYQHLVSLITSSTDPRIVAQALREVTGSNDLYVADLNAIREAPILSPNAPVVQQLVQSGFEVWLDYGHREDFDEATFLVAGPAGLILGTETLSGLGTLIHTSLLANGHPPVRVSVDLRAGKPRMNAEGWGLEPSAPVEELIRVIVEVGEISRLLILDLAQVGTATGPSTVTMCAWVRRTYPHVDLWTGGGIRDRDDVRRLADVGVDAVLVASALHDGRVTRQSF